MLMDMYIVMIEHVTTYLLKVYTKYTTVRNILVERRPTSTKCDRYLLCENQIYRVTEIPPPDKDMRNDRH